jgi:hypothetical protein
LDASEDEPEPLFDELLVGLVDVLFELLVAPFVDEVPDPSVVTGELADVVAEPTPRTMAVPTAPAAPSATTPWRALWVRPSCCSRVVMTRG